MAVDILTKGKIPDFSVNNRTNKFYLLTLSMYLLRKKNKIGSALKIANLCFELGDERHVFFRHLSDLHGRLEDFEKAIEYGQRAVDAKNNNPGSTKTHLEHLASMQRSAGDISGALATIDKLLGLDEKRATAHMNKCMTLLHAENYTAAIESALTAIHLGDERSWTFRHLSNLYQRVDDRQKAIDYAQKAVDARDNSELSLKNHLEHLRQLKLQQAA